MKTVFRLARIVAPFAVGVTVGVRLFDRGPIIGLWGACLFSVLALALLFEVTYGD